MYVKRLLPAVAILGVLYFAASASADNVNINFSFTGNGSSASGGTWFWAGGTSALSAAFDESASVNSNPINNAVVDVVTGPGMGASGTINYPFNFGPSSADSITISGCANVSGTATCGTLFTGSFQLGEFLYTGIGPTVGLTGVDVTGTLSAALAASLGVSPNVTGSLTGILDGSISTGGGSGYTAGGDLSLVTTGSGAPPPPAVPEPSELFLFATGLFALAAYLVAKRRN